MAISQNDEKAFNPVKINLYELIVDEIESINTLAELKQITLNQSVEPNIHITADFRMVKTIFRNLIGNALKYSNVGGEITISGSEVKPFVEISIKDNGVGISMERQKNIFKAEAIHSIEGTLNEKVMGLGLLICKEFVEIHGGNIKIESKPYKGSKIKFTLPRYI